MAGVRQKVGKGFYWARGRCDSAKDWKTAQELTFMAELANMYKGVKNFFIPPTKHRRLSQQGQALVQEDLLDDEKVGEMIRTFTAEILAMNENIQKALKHKGELAKGQLKDIGKKVGKSVAMKLPTAVPRWAMTLGTGAIKDLAEEVKDVVPDLVVMSGDALARKNDRIKYYADQGLQDHAEVLSVARRLIETLKEEGRLPNTFDKRRKNLKTQKTVTLEYECKKLADACDTYEKSLDDLIGVKDWWEPENSPSTPLLTDKDDDAASPSRVHQQQMSGAPRRRLSSTEAMMWGQVNEDSKEDSKYGS